MLEVRRLVVSLLCVLTGSQYLLLSLTPIGGGLEKDGMHHMVNTTRGIITLYRHQKAAFAITSKRGPAPKAPKAPSTDLPPGSILSTDNDEVPKKRPHNPTHLQPPMVFPSVRLFVCLFVCVFRARSLF